MTMHSLGFRAVRNSFNLLPGLNASNAYRVADIISELLERDCRELRKENPVLIKATEESVGRGRPPLYQRAREIQEAHIRDLPADPRHRETLSWTYSNLGDILLEHDRLDEATSLHRQAIAIHECVSGATAATPVTAATSPFAVAISPRPWPPPATVSRPCVFWRVIEGLETLVQADPAEVEDRWRLARCREEVAIILIRSGRPAEAAASLAQAAGVQEALARDNPSLYRDDLVRNCLYNACQHASTGRPEDALALIRRAEGLLDQPPPVLAGSLYEAACAYSVWSVSGTELRPRPARGASSGRWRRFRRAVATGYDASGRICKIFAARSFSPPPRLPGTHHGHGVSHRSLPVLNLASLEYAETRTPRIQAGRTH